MTKQLQVAQYYCSFKDHDKNIKGLNNFKSLYIKSLIDEDKALEIKALQGLIKCSKLLRIDSKEYQKELDTLLGKKARTKPKKHVEKKSYQKPKIVKNRLKKVILRKGYVEFYFDFPLQKSAIHHSQLAYKKKRIYKDIYDIDATLGFKRRTYRLKSVKYLKIAQYNKRQVRIVFEHTKPFTTSYKIVAEKLVIYLQKGSKRSSTKSLYVPPVIKNSKKVIVIDPGHGGKDSGAMGYKRKKEKDIVLQIAKRVYKKLKAQGYKVYLTRRGDYFISLRNRTKFANKVKANLFVSIHANAAPKKSKYLSMKGLETFFLSPARSERAKRIAALENRVAMKHLSYYSKNVFLNFINREKTIQSNKLAIDIHRNVLYKIRQRYSVVDGGVRPGPFWVLVGAQMPAVLIEVGYITNPTEAKRLSSPYYQELIAEGIAAGIASYFRHNE